MTFVQINSSNEKNVLGTKVYILAKDVNTERKFEDYIFYFFYDYTVINFSNINILF